MENDNNLCPKCLKPRCNFSLMGLTHGPTENLLIGNPLFCHAKAAPWAKDGCQLDLGASTKLGKSH